MSHFLLISVEESGKTGGLSSRHSHFLRESI